MTIDELRAECERAEEQMKNHHDLAGIVVCVPPRKRWRPTYRIARGLHGRVISGTMTHLNVFIKCTTIRRFLALVEAEANATRPPT